MCRLSIPPSSLRVLILAAMALPSLGVRKRGHPTLGIRVPTCFEDRGQRSTEAQMRGPLANHSEEHAASEYDQSLDLTVTRIWRGLVLHGMLRPTTTDKPMLNEHLKMSPASATGLRNCHYLFDSQKQPVYNPKTTTSYPIWPNQATKECPRSHAQTVSASQSSSAKDHVSTEAKAPA